MGQERKRADALAYIEFMRKSDELLKDIGSVSYGGAEQVLNQLNAYKDKYGHALTTGRLDTAISEWESIVQDKRERYERTADIRKAYDNQIASIDANLKRNEDMIAGQREGAIKQAYSNYDRSKSTYGQNAEKLARMGLGNSGYSDYLTGVAYGNMVGGIENANTTANEALEKAYYNADQQKLQAAAERDTAIANAEKAYGEKEASLIAAINSGEIDLETATGKAKAYGLTSGTIANLEKVAKAYEDKVNTENTNNAIKNLDTYFGGNYTDENGNPIIYTEQQIRDLAKTAGYDETKIEQLVKDNKAKVVNLYSSAITSETTDEEIDLFGLSPEATTELKAIRDSKKADDTTSTENQKVKDVVAQFETTPKMGDDTNVDKEFENGEISLDAYQQMYFGKALSWIEGIDKPKEVEEGIAELDRLLHREKISPADYESLKKYLYDNAATSLDDGTYSITEGNYGRTRISFGKHTYDVGTLPTGWIRGKIANTLNEFRKNNNVDLVMYNNKLYLYQGGEWEQIDTAVFKENTESNVLSQMKKDFKAYAKSYGKIPTKPTHQKAEEQ